jgi:hypothetical protein
MPHKNDNPIEPELEIDGGVNRRDFMKTSALLGGSLLLAGAAVPVIAQNQGASKDAGGPTSTTFRKTRSTRPASSATPTAA